MKKLAKKLLFALLLVSVTLPVLCAQPVQAASKKSKALKAYRAFLAQSTIPWGTNTNYQISTQNCEFTLAYINKDSVPELVVRCYSAAHAAGYGAIYAYKNGKVTGVTNINLDNSKDQFRYYKKKNLYREYYVMGGENTSYVRLTKTGRVGKLFIFYNDGVSTSQPLGTSYYDAKGNRITKSKFNSKLKKLTGGKKQTKAKFRKNTAKNRKKYIK